MDNRTVQLPANFFAAVATVSPTFLDAHDLLCLHCGTDWAHFIDDEWVRHDVAGDYIECPSCVARYRPRDGRFVNHGNYRPERWCGGCQMWRPVGRDPRDAVHACVVCGRPFDERVDPPEQALMDARRSTPVGDADDGTETCAPDAP